MKTNKAILTRTGKKGLLLIFLLMLCLKSNAQFDQKFTQYMNNEMFINPAYTGTREYTAITLAYRNQWVGVDGAPKTQTFSIHSPIKEGWGLGISALNEEIGITHQLKFNGSYAYQIKINRKDRYKIKMDNPIIKNKIGKIIPRPLYPSFAIVLSIFILPVRCVLSNLS